MFRSLVMTMTVLCASLSASAQVLLSPAPLSDKNMTALSMATVTSTDGVSLKISKLSVSKGRFSVSMVRPNLPTLILQGSLTVNEVDIAVARVDRVSFESQEDYTQQIFALFHRAIAQTNEQALEEFNAARPDGAAMMKVQEKYTAPAWLELNAKFIEIAESTVNWYMNGQATASEKASAL